MTGLQGLFFWGFLLAFGIVMYLVAPRSKDEAGFFRGHDEKGRPASEWALMMSIFISWIFAKSVTNAANLGATYGVVGGLAYAAYWLSIPVAGIVIYRLRTREGATGMVPFLIGKYGRGAALAFSLAILIRLFNEVWSNTAVVGGYYGDSGSAGFIGSALLFTAAVLFYSLKGGLRSSIFSDVIQAVVFMLFLGVVLAYVLPAHAPGVLLSQGTFALDSGGDLLLVALLQAAVVPVPRSRADGPRLHHPRKDHAAGVHRGRRARFPGHLRVQPGGCACAPGGPCRPAATCRPRWPRAWALAGFFAMIVVMVTSAGSTLDSTFTSLSKLVARELPLVAGRLPSPKAMTIGSLTMVSFALLGNLPMIAGTDILKATTISGTMVIGLAPIFLFSGRVGYSPMSFHLAFWIGIGLGVLQVLNLIPPSWAIGGGKYGVLLGTNLYGLALCTAGFFLPLVLPRYRLSRTGAAA